MDEGLRKAYKYKLTPTPDQERQLKDVVWRCRTLYNTALEQRITVDRQRGVTLTGSQQHAELPDLKSAFPEYAAIHSQVLQDVLTRLDKTYQAFFRRVKSGTKDSKERQDRKDSKDSKDSKERQDRKDSKDRQDRQTPGFPRFRAATATTPSPTSSMAMARNWRPTGGRNG